MSDLIDRNDLYNEMNGKRLELHEKGISWSEFCRGFGFAMEFVKQLPSAEPERKNGKWIDGMPYVNSHWRVCSVCKESAPESSGGYYFCPHCGADMRGE